MNREGLRISTPTDTTIVLTRSFDAPVRLVWEAMFTPERMRRWMLPPPGLAISSLVCEPRLGGALHITWKNDETDPLMTLSGEFTAIEHHVRAVHTENIALADGQVISSLVEEHAFTEEGSLTKMRITQTYDSKDARDAALGSGMDQGMEACYRALDALLGS